MLVPLSVFAELPPVVSPENHESRVSKAEVFEFVENGPNIAISVGNGSVVSPAKLFDFPCWQSRVDGPGCIERANIMVRPRLTEQEGGTRDIRGDGERRGEERRGEWE